jgi:anti-sigma B factor antagonist
MAGSGEALGPSPEEFRIRNAETKGLVGVAVSGELDAGTSHQLAPALAEFNGDSILLDLDECTFVDSKGIQAIIQAVRRLDNEGRELVVCNVRAQVRELVELIRLDSLDGVRVHSGPPPDDDGAGPHDEG